MMVTVVKTVENTFGEQCEINNQNISGQMVREHKRSPAVDSTFTC